MLSNVTCSSKIPKNIGDWNLGLSAHRIIWRKAASKGVIPRMPRSHRHHIDRSAQRLRKVMPPSVGRLVTRQLPPQLRLSLRALSAAVLLSPSRITNYLHQRSTQRPKSPNSDDLSGGVSSNVFRIKIPKNVGADKERKGAKSEKKAKRTCNAEDRNFSRSFLSCDFRQIPSS